jgi:hypothetical protein
MAILSGHRVTCHGAARRLVPIVVVERRVVHHPLQFVLADRLQHVCLRTIGCLKAHDVALSIRPDRKGDIGDLNAGLSRADCQK